MNYDAFSFHSDPQNAKAIEWGPNGQLAYATEEFVSIYQLVPSRSFSLLRTISRHKSLITALRWNHPHVEMTKLDSFLSFLACGDDEGNCIIYDTHTGARHAGISPLKGSSVSIVDIKWSLLRPSTIFVLTSTPTIICFQVGSSAHRRSSAVESCEDHGIPFQTFNMAPLWAQNLRNKFDFMASDPLNTSRITLVSHSGLYQHFFVDTNSNLCNASKPDKFLQTKIISADYFPFAQNRLTLLMHSSLLVFDLSTKSESFILSNPSASFIQTHHFFCPSHPTHFWLVTTQGSIIRCEIQDGKWMIVAQNPQIGCSILCSAVDPANPDQIAVLSTNGSVFVFKEYKSKIFVSAFLPGLTDSPISWAANFGKVAILSDRKILTFIDGLKKYRYQVDSGAHTVAFYGDKVMIGSHRLFRLDTKERTIEIEHQLPFIGSNMSVFEDTIASTPMTNALEVLFADGSKRRAVFKDRIVCYSANVVDSTKWVVFLGNANGYAIDVKNESKIIKWFGLDRNLGDVVQCVFDGDQIFHVTSTGFLVRTYLTDQPSKSISISTTGIVKLKSIDKYLCIVDALNTMAMISKETLKVTSICKRKALDIQMLTPNQIIAQLSPYSYKVLDFPTLDNTSAKVEIENTSKRRFMSSVTLVEMEQIALEVGDLEFVQFIRILTKNPVLPVASSYELPHSKFLENERSTFVCDQQNEKLKELKLEHFILTHDAAKAAQCALSSGTRESVLLAHVCLAPSVEAVKQISTSIDIDGFERLIAQMFVLADDRDSASLLLLETKNLDAALKFIKMSYNDIEGAAMMKAWLIKKFGSVRANFVFFALCGDHHAAICELEANNEFAKSMAYLRFLQENSIEVTESQFTEELKLIPYDKAQQAVQIKWDQLKQLFSKK